MIDDSVSVVQHRSRVSVRAAVSLARVAAGAGGALAVIGTAVFVGTGRAAFGWPFGPFMTLLAVFFAVFVWLVVPQQPFNAVVWTMTASAFFGGLYVAGWSAAVVVIDDPSVMMGKSFITADLPTAGAWILLFSEPAWIGAIIPLLTFGLLLFPDGRLSSPRWRWVGLLASASIVLSAVGAIWGLRPGSTHDYQSSAPLDVGSLLFLAAALLSLVALVSRFRGSTATARQQLKWVVWGTSVLVPAIMVSTALGGGQYEELTFVPLLMALIVFLASYGIAVGKYRLYDIDVVINKTVTVTGLGVVIVVLYAGIVVGLGALVGSGDGTKVGVQVAATVVVALVFGPVRRRAQQWANRAVYGARATPYEILARFAHRAAEASDDELLARIPRLIVDGTGAVEATLWVSSKDGFRPAAIWPDAAKRGDIPLADFFMDPDADYSLPVFHDGELLGGLSLVKTRGEQLPAAAEQLVADLASGMGLALRNARLTAELRQQVVQLEASRERVLAAADEARRALERDLDSGPQQQLVALKVMLGPTHKQAVQAGATKTAEMLAQLESDAGEAIRAVREFSGGVYPPLLEAEGLAVAITQQTQKSPLPIVVKANGLGRYQREVEAAVYFAILEALQNIAKYAEASKVSVVLSQSDGRLSFEVSDDGVGFELSNVGTGSGLVNMADRLDAVGGSWNLESAPGAGTTVRGTVPVG